MDSLAAFLIKRNFGLYLDTAAGCLQSALIVIMIRTAGDVTGKAGSLNRIKRTEQVEVYVTGSRSGIDETGSAVCFNVT